MRKGTTLLAGATAICAAVMLAGCASSWPEALPEPEQWQVRASPVMNHQPSDGINDPLSDKAVVYSAYIYSSNWQDRITRTWDANQVWQPSRLDITCIDRNGSLDGSIEVIMVPSKLVLRHWHPKNWEAASVFFTKGRTQTSPVDMVVNADVLRGGVGPFIQGPENVGKFLDGLKNHALIDSASLDVRATFPGDENTPLVLSFPLGKESGADRVRLLYERCGGVW